MKILAIETSCDETAVCILECAGTPEKGDFEMKILGNTLHSQISLHEAYGGVVPMMAKREHAKNLIPLMRKALAEAQTKAEAGTEKITKQKITIDEELVGKLFGREEEFRNDFLEFIRTAPSLPVDAIAVTEGPGLEPALWMGIIFAEALSSVFDIPLIPVNHMEGHILSVLPQKITFPALSLLISGGHTELVLMREWNSYEVIGQTRDDAAGEAFDKVARMLGLPYPGGPEISKLAGQGRTKTSTIPYILPRPMINSKDYDFSFSGLKTAVLYSLKHGEIDKEIVSKEFEDAVTDVLIAKSFKAVDEFGIRTLIIGGGVISNSYIQDRFKQKAEAYGDLSLLLPPKESRTDNAIMIGIAGYIRQLYDITSKKGLKARGNWSLTEHI